MARAGTNLRTSYVEANEVLRRPYQKVLIAIVLAGALLLPAASSTYFVHLLDLCLLSAIGALGLMLLRCAPSWMLAPTCWRCRTLGIYAPSGNGPANYCLKKPT
jgi:hypothetical protein